MQSVVECNLYQYAGNSPLVMVDLSGLEAMIGASPITDAPIICSECSSQPNSPPRSTWERLKDTIRDDGLRTIEALPVGMAAKAPVILGKAPALFEKLSSLSSQMLAKITAPWASKVTKSVGKFDVHPRVADQLNDPRMGRLQGKLTNDDLQQLANKPNAMRVLDNRSGNINVIQEVEGKTLRITVPRDDMKIISVGPIRPNQVQNLLEKGDFTPLK